MDYRDIAGLAVQIAAVLLCDDFEADRNDLEAVVELTNFDQLGLPGLAAAGAPKMFDPAGVGHALSMRADPGSSEQFRTLQKFKLGHKGLN
jgi:hypothetical protein